MRHPLSISLVTLALIACGHAADDDGNEQAIAKMLESFNSTLRTEPGSEALLRDLGNGAAIPDATPCHHDDEIVALQGRAAPRALRLANGTVNTVWVLVTDQPVCVSQVTPTEDSPVVGMISRFEIIGQPPPADTEIELTGKLSTGNLTQYYAEPNALTVTSGRKIAAPSLGITPAVIDATLVAMQHCLAQLPDVPSGTEIAITPAIRRDVDGCGRQYATIMTPSIGVSAAGEAAAVVETFRAMGCEYAVPTDEDMAKPEGTREIVCRDSRRLR
jgi:hypothetical protein